MPDIYREKAKVLFEKYYNIEIDHKMTIEEKYVPVHPLINTAIEFLAEKSVMRI